MGRTKTEIRPAEPRFRTPQSPNRPSHTAKGGQSGHPDVVEWQRFLRGWSDPDVAGRLAEHLDACPLCADIYFALPPPTYYSLGRPLPPIFALSPMEIGSQVQRLLSAIKARQDEGGLFRVAGDWHSESSLYLVLSLAITKLRHLGHTVAVCGEVFSTDELPTTPEADFAVLLEAPAYRSWPLWGERRGERLTLVVGPQFDWPGPVDFTLARGDEQGCRRILLSYGEAFRAIWRESTNRIVRDALTLNSFGIDCPSEWASVVHCSPLFAPVETQAGHPVGWWSVEGQWAAWESLRDLVTRRDVEDLARRMTAFPALTRRLRTRSEERNLRT